MNENEKLEIYDKIRALLKAYAPPYKIREGKNISGKQSMELWAEDGEYEFAGKKRKEVYFAGLVIQKSYVGFYFMPIYSDEAAMRQIFSQRLLKCLKGKSCFYITTNDAEMLNDIKQALAEGFKVYKQRGWV